MRHTRRGTNTVLGDSAVIFASSMVCDGDIDLKVGMSTSPAPKFKLSSLHMRYQQILRTLKHTVKAVVLLLGAQRTPARKGFAGNVHKDTTFSLTGNHICRTEVTPSNSRYSRSGSKFTYHHIYKVGGN